MPSPLTRLAQVGELKLGSLLTPCQGRRGEWWWYYLAEAGECSGWQGPLVPRSGQGRASGRSILRLPDQSLREWAVAVLYPPPRSLARVGEPEWSRHSATADLKLAGVRAHAHTHTHTHAHARAHTHGQGTLPLHSSSPQVCAVKTFSLLSL